jgi:hypothetical protein
MKRSAQTGFGASKVGASKKATRKIGQEAYLVEHVLPAGDKPGWPNPEGLLAKHRAVTRS